MFKIFPDSVGVTGEIGMFVREDEKVFRDARILMEMVPKKQRGGCIFWRMKQKLMWDKLCEARQFLIDSTTDKSQVKLEEGWNGTIDIVQVTFENGLIVADAVSDFKEYLLLSDLLILLETLMTIFTELVNGDYLRVIDYDLNPVPEFQFAPKFRELLECKLS